MSFDFVENHKSTKSFTAKSVAWLRVKMHMVKNPFNIGRPKL